MTDYKFVRESEARYERVKNQPTVKRINELMQKVEELKKYIKMTNGDVPEDVMEVRDFVLKTYIEVIRDADERKGRGCMTKSSDQVRFAEKMFNQVRGKYDKKYL